MAFTDLSREDQEACVLGVLQDLLGTNPSAADYLELYEATCAITQAMKAALLAIEARPSPQAAPLVNAA